MGQGFSTAPGKGSSRGGHNPLPLHLSSKKDGSTLAERFAASHVVPCTIGGRHARSRRIRTSQDHRSPRSLGGGGKTAAALSVRAVLRRRDQHRPAVLGRHRLPVRAARQGPAGGLELRSDRIGTISRILF